ncbi:MAG: copper resistance protein B [Vicinamibacterales bacterium]
MRRRARAQEPAPSPDPHAGHEQAPDPHAGHRMPEPSPADTATLPPFIPPVTDEMRRAAFPDVDGHTLHDDQLHGYVLVDQLEWETTRGETGLGWDSKGWVGFDRDRLWFRAEGQRAGSRVTDAQTHLFYGRAVSRWWNVLGGIRQDFRPGPAQTWAAVGVQGLAPYWIEMEATAYLGASGRNHLRVEAEYELLLSNRLVLQSNVETELYGKEDPAHFRGAGLATVDAGIRLRYLIRRELAPYVGVVWHNKYFGTADLARAQGERTSGARLALGVRFWM